MKKLFTIILILSASLIQAQTNQDNLEVFFKTSDGEKGDPNSNATQVKVTYAIKVSATDNISKFHLKLGNTDNGNEKADLVIPFDPQASDLPAGVTYKRKENIIYIELGEYTGVANYNAQVSIEDKTGNIKKPIKKSK